MIDKIGGHRRSFSENLNELYKQGHVSLLMRQRLDKVREFGGAPPFTEATLPAMTICRRSSTSWSM